MNAIAAGLILSTMFAVQDRGSDRDILRKIETMRISVEFEDTPLSEIVDFIREVADINILLKGDVDGDTSISFSVKDIRIKTFLTYILKPNDYGFRVKEGILFIEDLESINAATISLRIYDVQDLVAPLRDMPGREITFGDEGIQFVGQPAEVGPEMGDFLVELLQTMTGSAAWDDNAEADMTYQNGLLIIRQTKEVHKKIEMLINMLRKLN